MKTQTLYKTRTAAAIAARKALGSAATRGKDFVISSKGTEGFNWKKLAAKPSAVTEDTIVAIDITSHPVPEKIKAPGKIETAYAAALEVAQKGKLPVPPDFGGPSGGRYTKLVDKISAMVAARDLAGLKAHWVTADHVNSRNALIGMYRDLAVIAIEAQDAEV